MAIENVTHQFFMIPKEVHDLACKLNINKKVLENDWLAMIHKAYALKSQGKVVHVQPYIPGLQPFILIIQDQWMLEMAMRFFIRVLEPSIYI